MKKVLSTIGTCFLMFIGYIKPTEILADEEKEMALEEKGKLNQTNAFVL